MKRLLAIVTGTPTAVVAVVDPSIFERAAHIIAAASWSHLL